MSGMVRPTAAPKPPAALRGPARLAWHFARSLTTPLVPEDYIDMIDPLRSPRSLRAKVVDVIPETAQASTIVLKPGLGWRGHQPGQFVRIGVDIDGVRLWRAYSITSGPRTDGLIAITVKAHSGGRVSSYLHETLRVGSIVQLEPASGEFIWDGSGGPVAFLTGGSGITPVMGMLRHRVAQQQAHAKRLHSTDSAAEFDSGDEIVVVHSDGHPEDVIFARELRNLAESGAIRLIERHTAVQGRLQPSELDELVPDWKSRTLYACGPAGMLRSLREHVEAAGRGDALHTEDFVVELAPAGAGGQLTLGEVHLDVPGEQNILDAAEEAGQLMPSGCRMGICMGCIMPLTSGAVWDMRTGEVTTAAAGGGVMVQTCINTVAGACELSTE